MHFHKRKIVDVFIHTHRTVFTLGLPDVYLNTGGLYIPFAHTYFVFNYIALDGLLRPFTITIIVLHAFVEAIVGFSSFLLHRIPLLCITKRKLCCAYLHTCRPMTLVL